MTTAETLLMTAILLRCGLLTEQPMQYPKRQEHLFQSLLVACSCGLATFLPFLQTVLRREAQ